MKKTATGNKKHKLSIYLLKVGIEPKDILKKELVSKKVNNAPDGSKFYIEEYLTKPEWCEYVGYEKLDVKNYRAVLFIPVKDRWFAIGFSNGRHMLDLSKCDKKFGLVTALNALNQDEIKSTDIFMPSDLSKKKRTQVTQQTNLVGLDFNGYTNILKNITGKVQDQYENLFKNITASENSLNLSTGEQCKQIDELLSDIYSIYSKGDYKKKFPELTNINEVNDVNLIYNLDSLLIRAIKQESDRLFIDIPYLIDYADASIFTYNIFKSKNRPEYSSICVDDLYQEIRDSKNLVNMDFLEKKKLILYDDNKKKPKEYPLYNCLVFDTSYDDKSYSFCHGSWYELDNLFSQKLNDEINNHKYNVNQLQEEAPIQIINYNENTHYKAEYDYNKELAYINNASLLDSKNIQMGGYNKIEACDVYFTVKGKSCCFIHVKHGGSSSGLSHLFAQGSNSLTLFKSRDPDFIAQLAKLTKQTPKEVSDSVNGAVRILYLILPKRPSKNSEEFKEISELPLFSKISLFKAIKEIKGTGATSNWALIKKDTKYH